MTDERAALEIQHLDYQYPTQDNATLQGIDLTIAPGELVLLVGPSGCGKTTLMLTLNGVIPRVLGGQLQGTIRVLDANPAEREVYEMAARVGLVFQDPDSQLCNIFVRDEVAFGPQNLLVPKAEILARIERVLHFVGLDRQEWRATFSLSGGQKQRVAIASVLAMECPLLVFDEPTANLDPEGAAEVRTLIRELNRTHGVTIIVVEHDISQFVDIATRLVVMDAGRIVFNGTPRDVFREHGAEIRDRIGLWLPQAVEFAIEAAKRGYVLHPFPLTVDQISLEELVHALDSHVPAPVPTAPSGEPIVRAQAISFTYPDGTQALQEVSFQVRRGEILAILGQNGSGKTTLSSLLIGLNRPTSGMLTVAGLDATQAKIHDLARKVGYVFQYPEHQFVADTVFDEVAFGLRQMKLTENQVEERALEMLARFGLDALRERHPFALSKGQKRRLSVASMLVLRPELFILDEPTTGQDLRNTLQLMDYLLDLRAQGLTILLITHSMELVARYATSVLVLKEGKIGFTGSPEALFEYLLGGGDQLHLDIPELYLLIYRLRERGVGVPLIHSAAELAALLPERRGEHAVCL